MRVRLWLYFGPSWNLPMLANLSREKHIEVFFQYLARLRVFLACCRCQLTCFFFFFVAVRYLRQMHLRSTTKQLKQRR